MNINAYHQPGVEAGKKAAAAVLDLQSKALAALSATPTTADQIAQTIGSPDSAETIYPVLEHLAANGRAGMNPGTGPAEATFTTRQMTIPPIRPLRK